jgi:hypothetical protein
MNVRTSLNPFGLSQRRAVMLAASFHRASRAHTIDQNSAHQSRGDPEEVCAALPLDLMLV